jgi:hypothetical protein
MSRLIESTHVSLGGAPSAVIVGFKPAEPKRVGRCLVANPGELV